MTQTKHNFDALRARLDPGDMFGLVSAFPQQMADAWERGLRFRDTLDLARPRQIVMCGMGGSAVAGNLVASYLGNRLHVPLHVNRSYRVEPAPAICHDALFVFSSYSGNTGETLTAYKSLRGKGIRAVAITSGGELAGLCREDGVPVCEVPGGMPPRAAVAYSFFPLVNVLEAAGVVTGTDEEYGPAHRAVGELCAAYASGDGAAATLAGKLHGRLPMVYAASGLMAAVARRWACQFNENSKSLAHFALFTELCHNEIVGWEALADLRERMFIVSLEDEEDHPLAAKQRDITLEILGAESAGIERVTASGNRMTRTLAAVLLGDFTSVYLAYLNGVDPTPVARIDLLKQRLKDA